MVQLYELLPSFSEKRFGIKYLNKLQLNNNSVCETDLFLLLETNVKSKKCSKIYVQYDSFLFYTGEKNSKWNSRESLQEIPSRAAYT